MDSLDHLQSDTWLRDNPVAAHLGSDEDVEHVLTNRQVGLRRTIDDDQHQIPPADDCGAVAVLTDRRILFLVGEPPERQGDFVESVPYEAVDDAVASYHLVAVADHDADAEEPLLVVGPVAFPDLPEGAADLPHIMDVPSRDLSRAAVVEAVKSRFRDDAVVAVKAGDDDRIATLLDVSYDIEAWEDVDMDGLRDRLDDV